MNYYDLLLARNLANKGDITTQSLSVTANGTYTAPSGKAYTPVNVAVDGYALKSLATPSEVASFTAAELPLNKLKVGINAVQDLHGYDHPWVGGAGKNKLPMTVDGIKAANTDGTWSGDSYTLNGTTFTIMTDGQNVVGIKVNNKPSKNTEFYIINDASNSCPFNGYILNGCNSGSNTTYDIRVSDIDTTSTMQTTGTGEVIDVTSTGKWKCTIMIRATYTPNNLMFYPMIRLATESDATFTPYSNICPISGWDAANVSDVDDVDNPTVTQTTTISLPQTVYGGELDVVNGGGNPNTYAMVDLGDLIWEDADGSGWIQSRVVTNIKTVPNRDIGNLVCEIFGVMSANDVYTKRYDSVISINNSGRLQAYCSQLANITSGVDIRTWMTGHKLAYELATPTTFTTQPTLIKSLNGQNNLSVDCGEVMECEWLESL